MYQYHQSQLITIDDHTTMLKKYIDQMASSLGELFPEMKAHPDVAIALCFDNLYSSVGPDILNDQISLEDFNNTINKYSNIYNFLNVNTWQELANQAKTNDAPLASSLRCTPQSK
jgi:hypothetical protein